MTWLDDYLRKVSYLKSNVFLSPYENQEIFIITDDNLESLYHAEIANFAYYSIKAGEESKCLQEVNLILERLLQDNFSRNVSIIAFGGGIVCDIAGFVSAIYKRGCKLLLMPTSLIAMVDASIGGKNGVNSRDYKNQFGTVKQADRINIDIDLLKTLPLAELKNGMAEVIKHGLLASQSYYEEALKFLDSIRVETISNAGLDSLIRESIAIKLAFVAGDESDKGQRRFLNFGHTLGHAIEKLYHFPHGQAVVWGMLQAVKISYQTGLMSKSIYQRIKSDLERINTFDDSVIDWDKIQEALLSDKKRQGVGLVFILLEDFAKPLVREIDFSIIKQTLFEENAK